MLNTHIRAAAKQRLPPLLLWEVTIRQLPSGKTKRKALLKDIVKRIDFSRSHGRADPLHAEVSLRAAGLRTGVSPRSWNGTAAGSGTDGKRMPWAVSVRMPPDTKEFRFSETPVTRAG